MTECEEIAEAMPDYINRHLTCAENSRIILHLAGCEACRTEMALTLALRRQAESTMAEVPSDVLETAFEKIPRFETDIGKMVSSGSVFMVFDLLSHYLNPLKQTLQLVRQIE